PWFEEADKTQTFTADDTLADSAASTTPPAGENPEGAGTAATTAMPGQGPQPIFVAAPSPPRPHGNRGAAGGIGVVAALVFGVLYAVVILLNALFTGETVLASIGTSALMLLGSIGFWVTIVIFFIAFWLFGAIVNRSRWSLWVV